jgi:hypothetical protein
MPTVACNPRQSPIHNPRTSPHNYAKVVEHKLGAIHKGIMNSNPHNHAQVVEHKLGANSQGITRIRVARSLQTQDEPMSLFWKWNAKSPIQEEALAYLY